MEELKLRRIHLYCNFILQDFKASNKDCIFENAFSEKTYKILEKYQEICFIPSTIQVFMHQRSHQKNTSRFNLFGTVVSLMFNLSCIIRGHIETITINGFAK